MTGRGAIATHVTQSAGVAPERIEAGYEWFGSHHVQDVTTGRIEAAVPWWEGLFEDAMVCATTRIGQPPSSAADVDAVVAQHDSRGGAA
jgi:hypothetical protein